MWLEESAALAITCSLMGAGCSNDLANTRDDSPDYVDVNRPAECPAGYKEVYRYEAVCDRGALFWAECQTIAHFDHCEVDPNDRSPAINPPKTPDSNPSPQECGGKTHEDDTECALDGSGGGGTAKSPTTCTYHCDGIEHMIILTVGMTRCPGESTYKIKWKNIKGFPRNY